MKEMAHYSSQFNLLRRWA